MKPKVVLTGIIALIAFFWWFAWTTDTTATTINFDESIKQELNKWSSNAMTIAISLILVVVIAKILPMNPAFKILGAIIIFVGAWMFWI